MGSWPTLAASDTASQLPPVRVKWPLPIRLRISSGVSSGPLANGVKLEQLKTKGKMIVGGFSCVEIENAIFINNGR